MKKKVKLLTSIASLGLALALMTFGVLAATAHNMQINSEVSFTANNVHVKVEAWEVSGKVLATITDILNNATAEGNGYQTVEIKDGVAPTPITLMGNDGLDDNTYVYAYRVKITNLGGTKVDVALGTGTLVDDTTKTGVAIETSQAAATLDIAGGANDSCEYIVSIVINPNTALDFADQSLSTNFDLTRVVAAA